ncbi:pirin family protein [Luteibaculum oceani]|uniref:Pirin family protein n=1 Tax=Luteibaculum oceani TaxID=1294296 RepID=A0A5C6UV02_9FLAO|nr:pirin family protein [Luteibaculum oceani]TXC76071.1 pirin family protein [Luteibaculum oceani]
MEYILHPASSRGYANHGWLKSYHSFSFANFYDPNLMGFGALRVLNDDWVAPAMGFPTHPHQNMEIITIPLEGEIKHADSMGQSETLKPGQIQVMSAGTGVSHSEFNASSEQALSFLQIWIIPQSTGTEPSYTTLNLTPQHKSWQVIASPTEEEEGATINQNAWILNGKFDANSQETYSLKKPSNGVYVFVIDGAIQVGDEHLGKRDAIGIVNTEEINIKTTADSRVLLFEVPLK